MTDERKERAGETYEDGYPYGEEDVGMDRKRKDFNFSMTREGYEDYGKEKDLFHKYMDIGSLSVGDQDFKDEFKTFYGQDLQRMPSEHYHPFAFSYGDPGEQPLFVNVRQYKWIKKRKKRRDYLDSITSSKTESGYLHESRHKHAMNRPRAPTGRFLTKKEAEEKQRRERSA